MVLSKMLQILALTIIYTSSVSLAANPTYNVQAFGAKPDGKTDCTKAFLSAWSKACSVITPATVYVPRGRYILRGVRFSGVSCKNGAINIRIDGTLVAPTDYNVVGKVGRWLNFERVNGVTISGGTLDAQGQTLWSCKRSNGKSCPKGASSLAFYSSKNIVINGLTSLNSQMFHIVIYGCHNAYLTNVGIVAPGNSPNTDGIHVSHSSGVTIMSSNIGTGDDCVSIGPGVSNVWIEKVTCCPGHGISIGSLGWIAKEGVRNVTVKTSTFTGTTNGLRIKTWARSSDGFVRDVFYQHITMTNVRNPIIIDQNYCPNHQNCPKQGSGVKVTGVTYADVRGTSATQVAVKFDCSKMKPCDGIKMNGVNLSYKDKPAAATCTNARGTTIGLVKPMSCM